MSNYDIEKLKYKVTKSDIRDIASDMHDNVEVAKRELHRGNPDMKLVRKKLNKISNAAISINGLLNHEENEKYNYQLVDFYEELAEEMGISITCDYDEGVDSNANQV